MDDFFSSRNKAWQKRFDDAYFKLETTMKVAKQEFADLGVIIREEKQKRTIDEAEEKEKENPNENLQSEIAQRADRILHLAERKKPKTEEVDIKTKYVFV